MLQKKYDSQNTQTVIYTYDNEEKVGRITDTANGLTHRYLYDISGRLTSHKETGGGRKFITTLGYDANDNVSKISDQVGDLLYTNTYTFDDDNRPVKAKTSTTSDNLTYDAWGRVSTEVIQQNTNGAVTTTITYYNPANGRTSTLPATYSTAISNNTIGYTYTYDSNGYIASITDSAGKHKYYQYDKLGQLVREDDEAAGATWVFTYDNRGNITSKKRYQYTTNTSPGTVLETINYTYKTTGWKDILTGVGGVTYTNDAIGNRTGDGTWTYTWEHGRQLASMSKTGTAITYAYGADGYRIGKSVTENNSTTQTEYYYRDGRLIEMISGSDRLHFFYNAVGSPISVLYNNTRYYYVRNAQGDVVAITTVSGIKAVAYSYDAWGKLLTTTGGLASTVGKANPLRYRGYVYDTETGLHYLGSRYYDPAVGRFINADDVSLLGANNTFAAFNLFAYCLNNPVGNLDVDGGFAITTLILIISVVIGAGAAVQHGYNMRQEGASWGDTILESAGVGLGWFATVYTLGMSVYPVYCDYSISQGRVPMTEIGGGNAYAETEKDLLTGNSPYEIGKAGENMAGIDQSAKSTIQINGRNRIPDELTNTALREVKNVKYISNTQQLRDYRDFALSTGRKYILVVRPTTVIARTVIAAGWKIELLR